MNGRDDRELLRQAMAEASLLPADDPVRRQLEQDVAGSGEWAQREWLDLIREDEALRITLRQVEVPPGLMTRLLLIPAQVPEIQQTQASRWLRWLHDLRAGWSKRSLAAAFLAVAVVAAVFWRVDYLPHEERRVETLALLAMQDHLNENNLAVRSSEPRKVENELANRLGFPVQLPELGSRFTLVGGRPCHLGGHLVAFTLWRVPGGGISSLFQFRLSDFGLASLKRKLVVRSSEPAANGDACEVTVWPVGEHGYALV
ncbi:MAG: hypothetical protein HY303_08995, partial [Candidatus Wallbacteria bacterium]|nr:hypothetical protein [Candidatus Wallbacteria bacterium]